VLEALRDTDVRHLLGRISAPTLVLHRRGDRAVRIGAGRHLASHIAQARFVELDGAEMATTLGNLMLFDPRERHQLADWSEARQAPALPSTLLRRFAEQVGDGPDRTAVVCEGACLTYAELDRLANRLARRLKRVGAAPDRLIGLHANRSLDLVVGIIGILKAGAAYLPLDPALPRSGLAFMLDDAGAVAVVTQRAIADQLPESGPARVHLDDLAAAQAETGDGGSSVTIEAHHLAYVIYTSGTTGRPKGVMVSHGNVERLFGVTQPDFQFSIDDVWTLFHSFAFDFSVWELWGALLFGGKLVVVPHAVSRDTSAFCSLLATEGVTVLNMTPSAFHQLIPVALQAPQLPLRLVIFGGEALELPTLRPWFDRYGDQRPQLVNMYGITETTVHVTICPLRRADAESTACLIGRPLPDLELFVLDPHGHPVPVGITGEIHVGGAGVARGYLNRPELTDERFIETIVFERSRRLYRSGDLARWRSDGALEYAGRIDHQIKLRGYRIEPGEIEATLCQHPQVREGIVLPRGSGHRQMLVAYVVSETEIETAKLRDWLSGRLPPYMVPSHLVRLERFPLTGNGKIDRAAFPEWSDKDVSGPLPYVAPLDPLEEQIAAIWCQTLSVARVGIEHNFFELGGHSLSAMQVASRIAQDLGVQVPLRSLFANPTIPALADLVRHAGPACADAIKPAAPQPDYPLSHAQQRLWLDDQLAGAGNYNVPEALRIEMAVDAAALEAALAGLVERHEILRTAFVLIDGEPRQRILSRAAVPLRHEDVSGSSDSETRTRDIIDGEVAAPFRLDVPPLLRVTLIRQSPKRSVLVMVLHHIVGDGWSRNVLHRELLALYRACREGLPAPLPPPPIQYRDYAVWESSRRFDRERSYWLAKLAGAPVRTLLPYDFRPPANRRFRGDRQGLCFDPETAGGLRAVAIRNKAPLSCVILGIFNLFLFRLTGQGDLCVGTVIANRDRPELENLLGCFVNVVPIRVRLSSTMEFDELLARVVECWHDALDHGSYPYDALVRDLDRAGGGAAARPFIDVLYAFQSETTRQIESEWTPACEAGETWRPLELSFAFSKADLFLSVHDHAEHGIGLTLEYDSDRFGPATIIRYLASLERFARMIAAAATDAVPRSSEGPT
jgi:amino acid adenylation domain-containing protein